MTLTPQPRVHYFSPIGSHTIRVTPIKNLGWLIKNMRHVEIATIQENIYERVGKGATLHIEGNRNDEVFIVDFHFADVTVCREWVAARSHFDYIGVTDKLA